MNLMPVDGYSARIEYDTETDQFRGEIFGLNEGADFLARISMRLDKSPRNHWMFFRGLQRERNWTKEVLLWEVESENAA